jgi:subtilisin family serine protease
MKWKNVFFIIALMLLTLAGCNKNDNTLQVPVGGQDKTLSLKSASLNGKYIVILNDDADFVKSDFRTRNGRVKEKAHGLLKKHDVAEDIEEVYETALQGFTVKMSFDQAKKLSKESNVKSVEADQIIALSPIEMQCKHSPKTSRTQLVPWGIKRVGGAGRGMDKTAWIIDSGIDLRHPDLNVDLYRSVSFLGRKTTPNDQNGHGTHVAGIIAAKNNRIGVVGVAAGAKLVSVRVLDRQGNGTLSAVIAGVNYVAANGEKGDVANMSLGGGISPTLDDAVVNASAKVNFVIAAGNESDDANNYSPGHLQGKNIYTISAMGKGDKWADFSNYGNPPIEFCAPGVDIYSTYNDDSYATMSGTSMSAPHVAGILLLGEIRTSGFVKDDPDGIPDPIAHR